MMSFVALSGTAVHAADSDAKDSITLSPVSQRFALDAGSQGSNKVTVRNDGTTVSNFLVYSRPYSLKNEAYEPDFEKTSSTTDVYQWMSFEKTSYTLNPGESIDIPYTIKVPATAAPGGHYGVVFIETQPPAGGNDSVSRKKRVGSIILANINGKTIQTGDVLSTSAPFWQTTPPMTVQSRVTNTGNTDFQAQTTFTIKDLFGSMKYRATQDFTIYPGTTRKVTLAWNGAPWFGLYKVDQSVKVLDKTNDSSHFVLMAPRWLPVTLIVLLAIGASYATLRRKRRS
jgi:hypothetical protein